MEYREYQDNAAERMRLTIPLMKKNDIAMTPANYAIWYEYVSGTNMSLNSAMDAHLDDNKKFT